MKFLNSDFKGIRKRTNFGPCCLPVLQNFVAIRMLNQTTDSSETDRNRSLHCIVQMSYNL